MGYNYLLLFFPKALYNSSLVHMVTVESCQLPSDKIHLTPCKVFVKNIFPLFAFIGYVYCPKKCSSSFNSALN